MLQENQVLDSLTDLFTKQQYHLLLCCAFAALIGGFIKSLVISFNYDEPHYLQEKFEAKNWNAALSNVFSRCILGAFSGLMYALLMVTAIKMEQGAVAKLIVFAVIIGYLAPDLWKTQERKMLERLSKGLDESVKSAFNKQNQPDS